MASLDSVAGNLDHFAFVSALAGCCVVFWADVQRCCRCSEKAGFFRHCGCAFNRWVIPGVGTYAASNIRRLGNVLINALTSTGIVTLVYGFSAFLPQIAENSLSRGGFHDLQDRPIQSIPGYAWVCHRLSLCLDTVVYDWIVGSTASDRAGDFVNLSRYLGQPDLDHNLGFLLGSTSRFVGAGWLKFLSLGVALLILSYILTVGSKPANLKIPVRPDDEFATIFFDERLLCPCADVFSMLLAGRYLRRKMHLRFGRMTGRALQ